MITSGARVREGLTKKVVFELGLKRRVDILSEWEKKDISGKRNSTTKTEGRKGPLRETRQVSWETRQCCFLQHSLLRRSSKK